jgi:quinol-cytochrome oxidoreductase complex cytochrome b subunit
VTRARTWTTRALAAELVVLVATGVALYFRYVPERQFEWDTVATNGDRFRFERTLHDVHQLSSLLLLVTAIAALALAATDGPPRRWVRSVGGTALVLVTLAASFTGALLSWDQLALWAVTVGTDLSGYTWLFDDDRVRFVLVDGREIGLPTLRRWFIVHLALAVPAAALVTLIWHRPPGEAQPSSGERDVTARRGAAELGRTRRHRPARRSRARANATPKRCVPPRPQRSGKRPHAARRLSRLARACVAAKCGGPGRI